MSEVVVQRYEDELEAETAAGLLRANGIPSRVRYRATMGPPRSVAPIRVVAPFGEYELLVADGDAAAAAELLEEPGPPSSRPQRYRWLGAVLLVLFVGPLVFNLIVTAIERLR